MSSSTPKVALDTSIIYVYLRGDKVKDKERYRAAKNLVRKLEERAGRGGCEVIISQLVLGELLAEYEKVFSDLSDEEKNNFLVELCMLIKRLNASCPPLHPRALAESGLDLSALSETSYLGPADVLIAIHAALEGCSVLLTDDGKLIHGKGMRNVLAQVSSKAMIISDELP